MRRPQALGLLEVHIEQGPLSQAERKDLAWSRRASHALVRGDGHGQDTHAGTTPMAPGTMLCSALRGWSRRQRRRPQAPTAVGTVGLLEVETGAPNVVPGEVFL